jgi:hypothetical protein
MEYTVSLQGVWKFIKPAKAKGYILQKSVVLRLVPEPSNPHDPNAVYVVRADNNEKLGYIPREQAKKLAIHLSKGLAYEAKVQDYTVTNHGKSTNQPHININLKLDIELQEIITLPPNTSTNRNVSGIYSITNLRNRKVYVGSSKTIGSRWEQHLRQLNRNSHTNHALQRDWNQYGSGVFEFKVIEINPLNLLTAEEVWIARLNSYIKGYNQTPNGQSGGGSASLELNDYPSVHDANPRNKQEGLSGHTTWLIVILIILVVVSVL